MVGKWFGKVIFLPAERQFYSSIFRLISIMTQQCSKGIDDAMAKYPLSAAESYGKKQSKYAFGFGQITLQKKLQLERHLAEQLHPYRCSLIVIN